LAALCQFLEKGGEVIANGGAMATVIFKGGERIHVELLSRPYLMKDAMKSRTEYLLEFQQA
jgi:preprotein translocase subunit YajC